MLQFRIQATPNPRARKYILNRDLKAEGKVSYTSPEECAHVPMACDLVSIAGVSQVHFFENVLTVTQDGNLDWAALDRAVQAVVTRCLPDHDIGFRDESAVAPPRVAPDGDPAQIAKIEAVLDETIRPSLQLDGGDIEVVAFDGQVLQIHYQGACGGCPSSMTATLHAITSVLRDEYSPDIEVAVV